MTLTASNPFDVLEKRLTNIENILSDMREHNKEPTFHEDKGEEIGGIQLAQQVTGLAKPTIYALVWQAKIPCMKQGKKLYFSRQELTDWIRQGRRKTLVEKQEDADDLLLRIKQNRTSIKLKPTARRKNKKASK